MKISELKNNFDYVLFDGDSIRMWNDNRMLLYEANCIEELGDFTGSCVINNGAFSIIQKLSNPTFEIVDNHLVVKSSNGTYRANIYDIYAPTDIKCGAYEEVDEAISFRVNGKDLKTISKCASKTEKRLCFLGVIFYDNGSIVATDTFKGQVIDFTDQPYKNAWSVPTDFIKLLPDNAFKLYFTKNYCYYTSYKEKEHLVITTRLYAGEAPNVLSVIKKYLGLGIKVDNWYKRPELEIVTSDYVVLDLNNNKITVDFVNDNDKIFTTTFESEFNGSYTSTISSECLELIEGIVNFGDNAPITCVKNNITTFIMTMRK